MSTLTVFTPAYNRAHTLPRTYESLCRQTSDDFEWLVIDDGSTDNTRELVEGWIAEKRIPIRYIYKENGGLHTGYNVAIANINTELNVCIDSDDYMPDDAVENIVNIWASLENKTNLSGIIGLDTTLDDNPIGGQFSKTGQLHRHEIIKFHQGDIKIVCRTDLMRKFYPMRSFDGEKNFNPIYYYCQVDSLMPFYVTNVNLCYVDYQPTGMTANIFNQYRNSPQSFAELRRLYLALDYFGAKDHIKNAIHYVSSCIFAKKWSDITKSPKPFLTTIALPLGVILNLYIRYRTNKTKH